MDIARYDEEYRKVAGAIKDADCVVINGEGSIVFTSPPRHEVLFQMMIIELAADHYRKPVFYINALASDCPVSGRDLESVQFISRVLEKCAAIALRDPESERIMREILPNQKIYCIPDALFYWQKRVKEYIEMIPPNGNMLLPRGEADDCQYDTLRFDRPYICIGRSSLAAWEPERSIEPYINLIYEVKKIGLTVYLFISCSGDTLLRKVAEMTGTPFIPLQTPVVAATAILANAKVVISGRFHPSIMASLNGTPCIFLSANAHKSNSLQKMLGYQNNEVFSVRPDTNEIKKISDLAKEYLRKGEGLRKEIMSTVRKYADNTSALLSIIDNANTK